MAASKSPALASASTWAFSTASLTYASSGFCRTMRAAVRCAASGQGRPCDERLLRISGVRQGVDRAIEIAGDGPFAGDASNDAVLRVLAPYLPGGGQSLFEGSDGFGAVTKPTTRLADRPV